MLSFFRKYQKVVFGFVTIMLVVSIAFFGTYSAVNDREVKEKDYVLGNAIDGSNMTHLQIEHLVRMISTDCLDSDAMFKGITPNYFNDGVIRKDFFETGLVSVLTEKYFDDLKKDLDERLVRQKRFKMYTHPEAPFISAEMVYSQFMPSLVKNIQEIRKDSFVLTKESFSKLSEIYVEQSHFPSYLLRRFLGYQEKQIKFVKPDPNLSQGDLSLFHFHTVEDWFGPSLVHLIAEVIHNGAIYAKEKGYKVGLEEVRQDLLKTGAAVLKAQKKEGEITPQEAHQAFRNQLVHLRLSEKNALNAWKKVMLFRKLLEDQPQKTLVDRLCYDQFHSFASEGVELDVYKLPKALRFADLSALFKFQVYLEAVSADKESSKQLIPSTSVKSMDAIAKEAPMLLEKTYEIEYAKIGKKDLTCSVTLKDTWNWESQKEHWNILRAKFPELASEKLGTADSRLEFLDQLEEAKRYQIDEYARGLIIGDQSPLVEDLLSQAPLSKTTIKVTLSNPKISLAGISDGNAFVALLDAAAVRNQESPSKSEIDATTTLEKYSQDQESFYRIYVLSKSPHAKLLTFEEASQKGLLDLMLDERLKKQHAAAKAEKPGLFQNDDGSSKEFNDVREEIGKYVFADLLKEIEKTAQEPLKKQKALGLGAKNDFYTTYRFYQLLKQSKEIIEKGSSLPNDQENFLQKQFNIVNEEEVVRRSKMPSWADESLFSMLPETFSDIKGSKESICFYKVKGRQPVDESMLQKHLAEGQKLISDDAKYFMMKELIDRIVTKDALHFDKTILEENS